MITHMHWRPLGNCPDSGYVILKYVCVGHNEQWVKKPIQMTLLWGMGKKMC